MIANKHKTMINMQDEVRDIICEFVNDTDGDNRKWVIDEVVLKIVNLVRS